MSRLPPPRGDGLSADPLSVTTPLEAETGLPIVSSAVAGAWAAMRLLGLDPSAPGVDRLLKRSWAQDSLTTASVAVALAQALKALGASLVFHNETHPPDAGGIEVARAARLRPAFGRTCILIKRAAPILDNVLYRS
ncbi:hypothetical protein [Amorphus orientalis]|uniref:aspartate racemase/maleate isomerase family protein n=1 Tax=Amorphus orientalis TaxID=649198 RepID=UPI0027D8FC9D|nr:hypothetical protein [Amorphus orientalis]